MNKKVLFVMLGQSNATGHNLPMTKQDKINTPLKNVYGLQRETNQSFDITRLTWSNYVSHGTNLGEDGDDNYSVSNCLAKLWQKEIDKGEDLPDLYIITISVGAQGVTENYMWYPFRKKKLVSGKLFECDISLYKFTKHILSLVEDDFDSIQVHWRGGEEESDVPAEKLRENIFGIYELLLCGFRNWLKEAPKIYLHKIVSFNSCNEKQLQSVKTVNHVFELFSKRCDDISVFDITNCPHFNPETKTNNIFLDDLVHYTKETNEWTAEKILESYKE